MRLPLRRKQRHSLVSGGSKPLFREEALLREACFFLRAFHTATLHYRPDAGEWG